MKLTKLTKLHQIVRRTPASAGVIALCGLSLAAGAALAADAPDAPAAAASAPAAAKWNVNQPPGEKRTAQLDVRTGTWMSVDVSPDGKQIVFDLLGDLYLMPIGGGEAKALTHSMSWEMQPRFSPDGQRIAFVSDAGGGDNIWVMNVDGTGARAISTEDFRLLNNPVWHPSGRYLLARKHFTGTRSLGSGEIWLYHLDGGKGQQLNEKPNWQKDLGEPAISPDGKYLYYSQDSTPGRVFEYNKDSNGEIFRIYRQDLTDGSSEPFVTGAGGSIRPTPSPDGKYLAFIRRLRDDTGSRTTLFLKDLKTGREFPAWKGLERDLQESWSVHGVYPGIAWTPDSKTLVAWAQGKLWRIDPFQSTVSEIGFHVKDERQISTAVRFAQDVAPAQFESRVLRWVKVAPDGKRVVYSAAGYLYANDLRDGKPVGEARRLTRQTDRFEYFPSLSRDGKQVVYVSWNDTEQGRVRILDLASGRDTVVTQEPGKYLAPAFSPDGKSVAYQKAKGGYLTSPWNSLEPGVYVASADGKGQPRRVTKDGEAPQFGADSQTLYVARTQRSSEVDSQHLLVRLRLDEHDEQQVAKSEFATAFTVSPDGQWLGFTERFHTYITPLTPSGKTLSIGPKADAMPLKKLDVNAGDYLQWSGDSKSLHYALGNELFTVALDEAFKPGFKPAERGQKIGPVLTADKPQGRIAIVGARIVTMKAQQPDQVIEDGVILIENDRIQAIGTRAEVAIPAGAETVQAAGKTIIPGLIDVHWHGAMGESEIIPQQSWVNYASLAFGLTTLHDPSNRTGDIFTQSEMQRAGRVVGPRIFSTGSVLYGAKADFSTVINSLDDAQTHLKRLKSAGAFSVKSYNQPRRDQRQQVLEAGRETRMMVVPEGGSLFQLNMNMIVDGHTGIEHALPVAKVYDDVKQLWPQTQVGYTPTLNVAYGGLDGEHYWYARTEVWRHPILSKFVPKGVLEPRSVRRETAPEEDFNVIQVARTATELQRAGVSVNIGAHGQREGLGAHWEMWMFALGGMTPLEALRTATLNPARYLGLDKDVGSLEPGKLADLVILDGDVLKDIRQSDRISKVMQGGRLYDIPTMNEVWPRKKPRQPFFFDGGNANAPVDAEAAGVEAGHGHGD
ncbi:amidohydrolase family protein [Roseateles amylovorans]|uniref:Amidohydrolase family protein n=1 Tax=Roseateles amylovorans TaxID=2978473 RepID=A0ABY6AYW4_9BURK|nr:amidohydrolase family protein [Roseateles amylovorans]UXH76265.1 amidohydrolase family protein [Roseateles amylovorans]